jgi:hypothetical protein
MVNWSLWPKAIFDVLITIDRGFEFEHNLEKITFGIVIVHVPRNRIDYDRPIFAELLAAAESVRLVR